MTEEEYAIETTAHCNRVRKFIESMIADLAKRANCHDGSKFGDPERAGLMEFTPLLKGSTYGSDEYKGFLKGLKPVLDHHYAENRHHPEHFENGIRGMTLIDLVEMFCDWRAAVERHANGDIVQSININQKRFGYSDDLKQILLNTVAREG